MATYAAAQAAQAGGGWDDAQGGPVSLGTGEPDGIDLAALLPDGLPSGRDAVREGYELGRGVDRAQSMFLVEKGVGSEREWRERARAEGVLCTCMNIGLATWSDTRDALGAIYEDALTRGVRPPDQIGRASCRERVSSPV